jgi:hypothetical protein
MPLDKYGYKATPPVGQNDNMACWAACLSWWLKAMKEGRPAWSQNQIIVEYDKHTDAEGGFPPKKLVEVFSKDQRLKISAGFFDPHKYRSTDLPLGDKPVIIAFKHPQAGTHMNVIFGQLNRQVIAMEPYHPYPGTDGKRTGTFIDRSVDFYLGNTTEIILAWPTVVFDNKP